MPVYLIALDSKFRRTGRKSCSSPRIKTICCGNLRIVRTRLFGQACHPRAAGTNRSTRVGAQENCSPASAGESAVWGTNSALCISILGDFYVRNGMGRVKWISSKSAELFEYLLMYRGKWISRSRLVTDIFAGMTVENAEKYLNTTVYQLRKSLEPLGLRDTIRSENDGYALELEGAVIDYEKFERRAGKLGSIEAVDVEEALDVERLYTGDLFGSKAYV